MTLSATTAALDEKLKAVYARPGLSEHPELQECLSTRAHQLLQMLEVQRETIQKGRNSFEIAPGANRAATMRGRIKEIHLNQEMRARVTCMWCSGWRKASRRWKACCRRWRNTAALI